MAFWTDGDDMTAKRRNREAFGTRAIWPAYDIAQGGAVTADVKPVDGDDAGAVETTHYTAAGTVAIIHNITITNSATAARQVQLNLVESGGSSTIANRIFNDTLQAGESYPFNGPWHVDPNDTIRSMAPAAAANEVGIRADLTEYIGHPAGVTCIVDDGTALTASHASYYACPGSGVQHATIVAMTLCNQDTVARAVEVAIVPSGQAAAGRYLILAETLEPNESLVLNTPRVLQPGDFISAKASVAAVVSFRVTPVEYATS